MQRTRILVSVAALLVLFGSTAAADVITSYNIFIDTSSLAGNPGGIYLSFSPGFDSDPASVAISAFEPLAGLPGGPAFTDGGVTGTLDTGNLTFTNYLYALNDYGEYVTFGASLSFTATFDLPDALVGSSGSELDIELTGPDLATPVLTSDQSGNIVEIPYDQTGLFTPTSTSPSATVTPASSATPEPGTPLLLLAGLGVIAFLPAHRRPRPGMNTAPANVR
jgi:hypothetical protein